MAEGNQRIRLSVMAFSLHLGRTTWASQSEGIAEIIFQIAADHHGRLRSIVPIGVAAGCNRRIGPSPRASNAVE
jgi:hypothetical protein